MISVSVPVVSLLRQLYDRWRRYFSSRRSASDHLWNSRRYFFSVILLARLVYSWVLRFRRNVCLAVISLSLIVSNMTMSRDYLEINLSSKCQCCKIDLYKIFSCLFNQFYVVRHSDSDQFLKRYFRYSKRVVDFIYWKLLCNDSSYNACIANSSLMNHSKMYFKFKLLLSFFSFSIIWCQVFYPARKLWPVNFWKV